MANKIETVCERNNISYKDVRGVMTNGARTKEDLIKEAGVCGECDSCKEYIPYVTSTLCGCKEVKMDDVIKLVQEGENSLEKIMKKTGAGTGEDCGKCQALIENIIELSH